jgi:hypothetical protein
MSTIDTMALMAQFINEAFALSIHGTLGGGHAMLQVSMFKFTLTANA